MNKLISFLAIFSIANVANAEQINFTGHFITGSGRIQVNDAFSGQFNFNVASPDLSRFDYPNNDPTLAPDGKLFDYPHNASGSIVFSGQQINAINNVELAFHDNQLVTQPMLDSVGAKINPGAYDEAVVTSSLRDFKTVNVEHSFTTPGWYDFATGVYTPPSTITFTVSELRLVSATSFNLLTLLDANTFSIGSLQNPSYQTLFDFNSGLFSGFSVFKNNFSDTGVMTKVFSGFGVVDSFQVTAVPVPAAFWLFGSAISIFAFRLRKKA